MMRKMRRLADLAAMIKDAKMTELSVAEEARRQCANRAAALRRARETSQNQATPDPAHLSGYADVWQDWSAGQLKRLAAEEAEAAAEVEAAKRAAAREFGRASVLQQISEEHRKSGKAVSD